MSGGAPLRGPALALHLVPWAAAILFFFTAGGTLSLGTSILVMILFALSLDLALGHGGIVTLGHAAFFGVGAYGAGIFAINVHPDPLLGLLAGTAAAALAGLLSGALILHTSGVTLLLLTLAVLNLLAEAANQLRWLTGGDDGLSGIRPAPLLGLFRFDLWGRTAYLYALAVLLLWFLLFWRVVRSPFGRGADGIRQNRARMRAIGTPVWRRQVALYGLSAAMAGSAGALSAQTTGIVGLSTLGVTLSGIVAVILVLGGTRRLYGAFLGAAVYILVQDFAARVNPYYWMFAVGAMLVATVLFLEAGLMSLLDRAAALLRRRR